MNFHLRPANGVSKNVISYRLIGQDAGVISFLVTNTGDQAVKLQFAEQGLTGAAALIGSAFTVVPFGSEVVKVVTHKNILSLVTTADNAGTSTVRIELRQSAVALGIEALDPVEVAMPGFGDGTSYATGGQVINKSVN